MSDHGVSVLRSWLKLLNPPHHILSLLLRYMNATCPLHKHTYLVQGIPWSWRRFPQGEAFPLHFGRADLCDLPKCGRLGHVIFVSGGLRSRSPLILLKLIHINTTSQIPSDVRIHPFPSAQQNESPQNWHTEGRTEIWGWFDCRGILRRTVKLIDNWNIYIGSSSLKSFF